MNTDTPKEKQRNYEDRTYTYTVLTPEGDIERTMTTQEIYKEYGIEHLSQKIVKLSSLDPYVLPDGKMIIEGGIEHEHFKTIVKTANFDYVLSTEGYVLEREKIYPKRNRARTWHNSKGELCFLTEEDEAYRIAPLVLEIFVEDMPEVYEIGYQDGNMDNCSLDNLLIILPKK